jgi:hypothetical protein
MRVVKQDFFNWSGAGYCSGPGGLMVQIEPMQLHDQYPREPFVPFPMDGIPGHV